MSRSRRPASSGLPPIGKYAAAIVGGLAAGAASIHLLHTRGAGVRDRLSDRTGLDLSPEPARPVAPTPEEHEAQEPGRGRMAQRPEHIPRKGWTDILWRLGGGYLGDRIGFVAGGVTFFILLSLFPTLGAFVTIYGLFADPNLAWERLEFLSSMLPDNVAIFIGGELERLASGSTGQLTFTLIWTLALSLWTANNGIKTLFYGLNLAYHEVERRNFLTYNALCFAFTLSALAAVLLSSALVVGVPVVVALLGVENEWRYLAPLRWPLLFMGYVAALTVIYRFGPCRQKARWRWLTPGALLAASLSVFVSFIFSWYLTNFVRLDSYGPLATAMGFLLWTWLSVQIILIGAKFNAEIEHQTAVDTTTGAPRPLGERGAIMADTLGPRRGNPAALAFTLKHAEAVADKVMRRRARRGGG